MTLAFLRLQTLVGLGFDTVKLGPNYRLGYVPRDACGARIHNVAFLLQAFAYRILQTWNFLRRRPRSTGAPEQPSVTRRCSAASTEKSMFKYQTIESYAPLATMSEPIAF
jgi:hypothetical protein